MTRPIKRRAAARRSLRPVYELGAFNVTGFCLAHGVSRSLFYRMRRSGAGPRIMKCGARTLVSVEAARVWRRACERAAAVSRRVMAAAGRHSSKDQRRGRVAGVRRPAHTRRR